VTVCRSLDSRIHLADEPRGCLKSQLLNNKQISELVVYYSQTLLITDVPVSALFFPFVIGATRKCGFLNNISRDKATFSYSDYEHSFSSYKSLF
jgi:hypothetical protein